MNILAILVFAACVDTGERGFKTSDPDFMSELRTSLKRENIPFREDQDGFLMYQRKHEETVNRLRVEVAEVINGGVAHNYHDQEAHNYLKSLLESKGMPYRIEASHDGEMIRWYPESEAQEKAITMSVVENIHRLNVQRQISEARCNKLKLSSKKLLNKRVGQEVGSVC